MVNGVGLTNSYEDGVKLMEIRRVDGEIFYGDLVGMELKVMGMLWGGRKFYGDMVRWC